MTHVDTTTFIVDSNVWMLLYEEAYPQDVFPGLYDAIEAFAKAGRVKAPYQVLDELGDDRKGVGAWVRSMNPTIIVRETQSVARMVAQIIEDFPHLIKGKTRTEADPYLVAHGHANGYIVVTEENFAIDPKSKPKIPNVCHAYKVECVKTLGMLRRLKIRI